MQFGILGPLEVRVDGRSLPLRGRKQKALLAILLLHANQVVSSERLIEELWGDEPPESGSTALQVRVSELRRAIGVAGGRDPIVTRSPGYLLQVEPDELDLLRFERLVAHASTALEAGELQTASQTAGEALALWRGRALADFAHEDFARAAIARLEELRLAAVELRIEADLARGRHMQLVGELAALVAEHPLSERLRAKLMLALYRSGRQAEALEVYRDGRQVLVDAVGIEPCPALRDLEKAILRQDPSLDLAGVAGAETGAELPERSILVAAVAGAGVNAVLGVAEPLARLPRRELILGRLVGDRRELADASAALEEQREALTSRGVVARAATFTSEEPGEDVVRLAAEQAVDLLLLDVPVEFVDTGVPPSWLRTILDHAPCDVGILVARTGAPPIDADHPVLVPFGGAEHDWAAVELGAWIARAQNAPLRLLGIEADPEAGGRDASRLLARASLVVQRATGLAAEPLLVPAGADWIAHAGEGGGLFVLGLSSRQGRRGLGTVRHALIRSARPPALLVRKGLRPGGLAPPETHTRFSWSLTRLEGEL